MREPFPLGNASGRGEDDVLKVGGFGGVKIRWVTRIVQPTNKIEEIEISPIPQLSRHRDREYECEEDTNDSCSNLHRVKGTPVPDAHRASPKVDAANPRPIVKG